MVASCAIRTGSGAVTLRISRSRVTATLISSSSAARRALYRRIASRCSARLLFRLVKKFIPIIIGLSIVKMRK